MRSMKSEINGMDVIEIGQAAFMNCKSLTEINVSEKILNYTSVDGAHDF